MTLPWMSGSTPHRPTLLAQAARTHTCPVRTKLLPVCVHDVTSRCNEVHGHFRCHNNHLFSLPSGAGTTSRASLTVARAALDGEGARSQAVRCPRLGRGRPAVSVLATPESAA